ncbi:MAG TPA: hypothetical protein VM802_11855 [Chitinophaga sp.]|uniref:hypothetical protein n=1 Tax=Chitinophaga sp. TaxID=1869181 RepID=UPI002C267AC4|nr:hypothetical protein [Chitinophaga sp.]HVI45562.1 hypothetical protein [Chitinophaga sp.]
MKPKLMAIFLVPLFVLFSGVPTKATKTISVTKTKRATQGITIFFHHTGGGRPQYGYISINGGPGIWVNNGFAIFNANIGDEYFAFFFEDGSAFGTITSGWMDVIL